MGTREQKDKGEKAFIEAYNKLNTKQKEAVDTIEGPVMVIAGPGTGKTTVLTLRIANILRLTDIPPSGILALTFTEAGAKNMKNRLRDLIGEKALEVPIYTFHSFARSVLNEYKDLLEDLSERTQLSDIESESLIRNILQQKKYKKLRPTGDSDFYIDKILKAISDCKREAWTPEIIRQVATQEIEGIKSDESSYSNRKQKNTVENNTGKGAKTLKGEAERRINKCERTLLLSEIYEQYEEEKKKDHKVDFDDLIFELILAVRENETLLKNLQEKYLYILVDEHQDTNDSQNILISLIADYFDNPNLFVVGDEKQGIFRFQGASIENFLEFQRKWQNIRIINLDNNYRSHQTMLDSVFSMIDKNYEEGEHKELRIKLVSETKGKPIDILTHEDKDSEDQTLLNKIREISDKEPKSTLAIIARRNSDIVSISGLLRREDIEHKMERGINIFSHRIGRLFFSILEFITKSELEALAETVAGGLWGIKFEEKTELIKSLRKGDTKKVSSLIATQELEKLSKLSPLEALIKISQVSKLENLFTEIVSIEVWRNIVNLAKNMIDKDTIEDPYELFGKLLEYKKSAEKKNIKIESGQSDARVTILTAHSAKGLEFDHVFIPYCNENVWIKTHNPTFFLLPNEQDKGGNIKDERRLFYVAMTRARKHLVLSRHEKEINGSEAIRLRFLEELDRETIEEKYIKKETNLDTNRQLGDLVDIENKEKKELTEYTKRVILENGISVTALNHFANCPNEFIYKSILRVPISPSLVSEKGSAMHFAISNIWNKKIEREVKGEQKLFEEKEIREILVSKASEYLEKSYISKRENEEVKEEISEQSLQIALSLLHHFNQKGEIKTESWFDMLHNQTVGEGKIEIKLHGKLDTVVFDSREVRIYDYKTREAMSENAIKGATKSGKDNGECFRQLVFYKILLQNQKEHGDKNILPSLVFLKPTQSGECKIVNLPIKDSDISDLEKLIEKLVERVWSDKIVGQKCSDEECMYCKYLNPNS